jgi:hypothetical protein
MSFLDTKIHTQKDRQSSVTPWSAHILSGYLYDHPLTRRMKSLVYGLHTPPNDKTTICSILLRGGTSNLQPTGKPTRTYLPGGITRNRDEGLCRNRHCDPPAFFIILL